MGTECRIPAAVTTPASAQALLGVAPSAASTPRVVPPARAATASIRQAHQSKPGSSSDCPRPDVSPMNRITATYIELDRTVVSVSEINAM